MNPAGPESPNTPPTMEEWVWLARIRKPQGRKGEVFAEILTDFPQKFAERRQLWLLHGSVADTRPRPPESNAQRPVSSPLPRKLQLSDHWFHKGGVVLHFDGVDSISSAESLVGLIVAVPRGERAPLGQDEVYISDLIGCTLVDVANPDNPTVIGQIEDVERDLGPVAMLVVRGPAGEVLVPFARSYLRKLSPSSKRIEMSLPEGLVDLNSAS